MWWLRFITTYLMLLRAARGLAVRGARARLLSARAPLPRRFASPRASTILFSRAAEAAAAAAASVVEVEEGASRRSLPSKLRKEVAFRQKYECAACGCLLPPDHEVDHVVPVALNGSDSLENLQALCRPCHSQKTRDQRHAILDAKRMPGAAAAPRPAPPRAPPVALNAQQAAAVDCGFGPVRVVAGPGTGKTRVLTRRVAHLVASLGEDAGSVLALTFTNRAANELRERIAEEVGPAAGSGISVGTFHRVCLTVLREDVEDVPGSAIRRGFAVYDQAAMIKLCGQCVSEKPPVGLGWDKGKVKPAAVQSRISAAKNAGLDAARYGELARAGYAGCDGVTAKVFALYEAELERRNAVDFDDMLGLTARLLQGSDAARAKYRNRWKHLLVDEFQDTNGVQYEVLRLLAAADETSSVFVVGDSDQAIYGWRGADYENQAKYDRDFSADRYKLEKNYRSVQPILSAATALVSATTRDRDAIELEGRADAKALPPAVVSLDDQDAEARWIADVCARATLSRKKPKTVAVLYRTNAQSRGVERELVRAGVPHQLLHARGFFDRREIRDCLAYLKLLAHDDDGAFERVVNVPPGRAVGAKSLEKLRAEARARNSTLLGACRNATTVSTRAAKGLVAFADLVDRLNATRAEDVSASGAADDAAGPARGSMPWFLLEVLRETGYEDWVRHESTDGAERWRNLRELANLAAPYEASQLVDFLDQVALVQDQDGLDADDEARTNVKLMTIHASKGLEFDVVVVAGCEEGLIPHYYATAEKSGADLAAALDEERRLLYVAMTRAKEALVLTKAATRLTWGVRRDADPSRFLDEIPDGRKRLLDVRGDRKKKTTPSSHRYL